jgi:hypothetical protein
MHTQNLQVFTAVGPTPLAGEALGVVHVGFDRATVARLDVGDTLTDRQHFDTQFVTWDSWVRVERHFAEVTTEVRATNSDPVNANKGFAGERSIRLGNVDQSKMKRFLKLNGSHGDLERG